MVILLPLSFMLHFRINAQKHIDLLIDKNGKKLEDNKSIGEEALQFYRGLMGSVCSKRKRVNL